VLIPLSEHQLLVFWVQLLALVAAARLFGATFRRFGLPSTIGELLAGVVLGPSVFGVVWPDGFEWFLPDDPAQSAALSAVAWIGIALLLVVTGFETDLPLMRRLGRATALVTAGSVVLPFIGGLIVGFGMPESFVGVDSTRTNAALFVAAALGVSSLAVVGKILSELNLMRRDFGQITVAAGMANDVIGWLLLAAFAGLATSGELSVATLVVTFGGLALFIVASFTVGQRAIDATLRWTRLSADPMGSALTVAIIVMLVFAVTTQALGVEAVLGAFVAGVLLHRSRFVDERVPERIEGITVRFLAPLFFATAGLRIDLTLLAEPEELAWIGIILLVAIVLKFIGAYVGARGAGLSNREGLALGSGLNARGTLELVIATVGLTLGVFTEAAFTAIALVPIVTSLVAASALRLVVRGWRGSDEEQERLDREESLSRNVVVRPRRMLILSRGRPSSIAAAQVLHFAWPPGAAATVLAVDVDRPPLDPLVNVLHDRDVDLHVVHSGKRTIVQRILEECELGYGAIGVGVAERQGGDLLGPLVGELVNDCPIPLVLVRPARHLESRLPGAFSRAFVPVSGGRSSRGAQEIAFNLSRELGTDIVLSHVVTEQASGDARATAPARPTSTLTGGDVASRLVRQAEDLAAELGVDTKAHVVRGRSSPGEGIVSAARAAEADLIVLGAHARRLEGRPYLGANVEHVLADSDATVVVVVLPGDLT
jgi:Kef-type K+ transport system membrane component KefB/nucleotide-binding universal stress UspA family protein